VSNKVLCPRICEGREREIEIEGKIDRESNKIMRISPILLNKMSIPST